MLAIVTTTAADGVTIVDDFTVGDPILADYTGSYGAAQLDLDPDHVLGGSRTILAPTVHVGFGSVDFSAEAGRIAFDLKDGAAGGGSFYLRYYDAFDFSSNAGEYLQATIDLLDAGLSKDRIAQRDYLDLALRARVYDSVSQITRSTVISRSVYNSDEPQRVFFAIDELIDSLGPDEHINRLDFEFNYLIENVEFAISDLRIAPLPIAQAGDYNADGAVDAADYSVWRDSVGAPSLLPNDPLGGVVGQAQYDLWRSNYGSGAAVSRGITAPEPRGPFMLLAGLSSGWAARWRRSPRRRPAAQRR